MVKILMVCLGNICRSPLAEGILKAKLDPNNYLVDSAGTASYHIGRAPDPRAIAIAKKHNLDISNLKARQFIVNDFKRFDYIYAMDASNYQNILKLASNEIDKAKVKLILNESYPNQNNEVPDPYYGGDQGFKNVYTMLNEACAIISKRIV